MKLRFVPAGMNPDELAAKAARSAAAAERKRAAPLPSPVTAPAVDLEAGPSKMLWILLALVVVAAVLFVLRGHA